MATALGLGIGLPYANPSWAPLEPPEPPPGDVVYFDNETIFFDNEAVFFDSGS